MDFADFGPFHENMIDDNNRCLLPLVHSNEQAIVPDIYMPEILLHIKAEVEETNRLLFLSQIFVRMLFIQERQNGSKNSAVWIFKKLICMSIGIISDKRNALEELYM